MMRMPMFTASTLPPRESRPASALSSDRVTGDRQGTIWITLTCLAGPSWNLWVSCVARRTSRHRKYKTRFVQLRCSAQKILGSILNVIYMNIHEPLKKNFDASRPREKHCKLSNKVTSNQDSLDGGGMQKWFHIPNSFQLNFYYTTTKKVLHYHCSAYRPSHLCFVSDMKSPGRHLPILIILILSVVMDGTTEAV